MNAKQVEIEPSNLYGPCRTLFMLLWMPLMILSVAFSYEALFTWRIAEMHWFTIGVIWFLVIVGPFILIEDLERMMVADQDPLYDTKLALSKTGNNSYIRAKVKRADALALQATSTLEYR